MTEYLFSYGTLTDSSVQRAIFNRILAEHRDCLKGFRLSTQKMYGQYLVIEKTGNERDMIWGSVLELQPGELSKADRYEGEAYTRMQVQLASGKKAWVYITA